MDFVVLVGEDVGIELVPREDRDEARCETCGRPLERSPDAVYRIEIGDPGELVDLMHAPPMYVASKAFVDWVARERLAGLAFESLGVAQGLSRVRPASAARLDPASVEANDTCASCGYREVAVEGDWRLEQGSWDGSAFFGLEERPELIFCTADAAEALGGSDLEGPSFMPPELMA